MSILVEYQPGCTVEVQKLLGECYACGSELALDPDQVQQWYLCHLQPNITHALLQGMGEWLPVRMRVTRQE